MAVIIWWISIRSVDNTHLTDGNFGNVSVGLFSKRINENSGNAEISTVNKTDGKVRTTVINKFNKHLKVSLVTCGLPYVFVVNNCLYETNRMHEDYE